MMVEEYLAWAEDNLGKYELVGGTIYAMAPETTGHAKVKFAAQTVLAEAMRAARLPCEMLPDGMKVRTGMTSHGPDALVYFGARLDRGTVVVPNPMTVVEVLSRSTRCIKATVKLPTTFGSSVSSTT